MAREWTDEQKKVIEQKNSNLLVAAAAGSGKTAVMVERIIQRVLSEDNPVDIDRIVVVTFTKAAAAQMRERIAAAFTDMLSKEQDEKRIRRIRSQISLIDNAVITTIDSFCNYVLGNYFNTIDLDPTFRIGDDAELTLIKADVIEEVIENAYATKGQAFTDFVEAYTKAKKDDAMENWIINMYEAAQSNPYPEEWINNCRANYNIETEEDFLNLPITQFVVQHVKAMMQSILAAHEAAYELLLSPNGIGNYVEAFEHDIEALKKVCDSGNYYELYDNLKFDFEKLNRAPKDCDQELKEMVQAVRDKTKSIVKEVKTEFFALTPEENLCMIKKLKPFADIFVELVLDFSAAYDARKREENILSFSDVEHLALSALVSKDGDEYSQTAVARELASLYEEIYIDEYQDSNKVQEMILSSISRGNNMFMVGDIKQSIYSFRQADPGIFLDKYNTYEENAVSGNALICLHKNFRSRENVLFSVNDIFQRIMKRELGDVEYDTDAMLVPGRDFDKSLEQDRFTELLLCDASEIKEMAEENDEDDPAKAELAARSVANKIRAMIGQDYQLWDDSLNDKAGGYRTIRYSDFVILLRSANKVGPVYAKVLSDAGIPAICNTSFGYFTAREIAEILNLLQVIDNPLQDIPFAGSIRSYFCYLTADEMARLRNTCKGAYYNCMLQYLDKAQGEDELALKLSAFKQMIDAYRQKASYLPIHELIKEIIYDSGYITYISALEGGKRKAANLDMLIAKAKEFENTSFHGLFSFLRYLDKIRKYEIDMGEADIVSENDNVVRIMSIHKSKGLEFPVVFVGEMQKRYNLRSSTDRINYHSKYGLAMDYVDLSLRVRRKSFFKKALACATQLESVGEELRVLYVALTRAIDKLILVGCTKSSEKSIAEWKNRAELDADSYSTIYKTIDYLNLCGPAFFKAGMGQFRLTVIDPKDVLYGVVAEDGVKLSFLDRLSEAKGEAAHAKKDAVDMFRKQLTLEYGNQLAVKMPGKFSVSELKHKKIEENENEAVQLVHIEKSSEPNQGAERGNAYHKIFELLDYNLAGNSEELRTFIDGLVSDKRISREYAELVNVEKYVSFMASDLGKRMKMAELAGRMYRERQFIAGFPAHRIRPEYVHCEELILVQGIIDCYFEEEDGIVIVDYKTDRVTPDTAEDILVSRYKEQLRLYADAVEQIAHKKVKECILYSVSVSRAIVVPLE